MYIPPQSYQQKKHDKETRVNIKEWSIEEYASHFFKAFGAFRLIREREKN
jgi:hypothetical protein